MIKISKNVMVELKRNIISVKFLFSIIGICFICLLFSRENLFIRENMPYYPAIYVYCACISINGFIIPVILCISSFNGAYSFCYDCKNHYGRYVISRTNANHYAWGKVYANIISSFWTTMLGLSLYCIIIEITLRNSILQDLNLVEGLAFHWRYYNNQPWLYYLAHNTILSAAATLWSTISLTVSSFMPDVMLTLSVPIVANYVLERFSILYLPEYFNLFNLVNGVEMKSLSFPSNIFYSIALFISLSLMFGFIFTYQLERRRINGFI